MLNINTGLLYRGHGLNSRLGSLYLSVCAVFLLLLRQGVTIEVTLTVKKN